MTVNIQLIVAILCTFIGFVVGAGVGMLIAGRTKNRPEEIVSPAISTQEPSPQPVPVPTPAPEPTPVPIPLETPVPTPVPIPQPASKFLQGVLLTQNPATGKLAVEWDGEPVPGIEDLRPDELQELRTIGREWFVWLSDNKKQPVKPAPAPGTPVRETTPSIEGSTIRSDFSSQTASADAAALHEAADEPIQNRLMSVVNQVTNGAKPPFDQSAIKNNPVLGGIEGGPAGTPPVKPLSMVGQIDEILQAMLKESPMLNRGIKLMEDPRRGVVVWVGLDQYVGIDSVADQEVKKIIRAAVAEWERRNEKK